MEQAIVGYHKDDENHWVAQLSCGHFQHVRHQPPFVNRPWVETLTGRQEKVGLSLNCVKCDDGALVDIDETIHGKCKMNIEIVENPEPEFKAFLDVKLAEFNWQNWEVSERKPLAVQLKNEQGEIIAGASARTFGDWLMLDTLWVSETLRGKDIGRQILEKVELAAKQRGCVKCILDTLNFQAKPFYEKYGYKVQWVQENYPKTGCKYFMVKVL